MKLWSAAVGFGLISVALGCGVGGAPGGSESLCTYDDVPYTIWQRADTDMWYRFLDDHRVEIRWRSMSGNPVQATYSLRGGKLTIDIPADVTNFKRKQEVYTRLDGCSMALTYIIYSDGTEDEEMEGVHVLQRSTPSCGCG